MATTFCPVVDTQCPDVVLPTECPVIETECPTATTWCPPVETWCPLIDIDVDEYLDICDNCPENYNPLQEDSYPPGGNNCGDVCECEGNFDGDHDQDNTDFTIFLQDHERTDCTDENPCNGDFDCDGDVGDDDLTIFLTDFGRSAYMNPCPSCVTVPWCAM